MPDGFHMPRVKVCGLRRAEDALQALAAGAEALGFVFHTASPRCADRDHVAAALTLLPDRVLTVAVVVDSTPASARELLAATGIKALQLCGDQVPKEWVGFEAPILRRIGVDSSAPKEIAAWRDIAAGFLLDHPATPGGSGKTVDFDLAAQLAANASCLLAGGLQATAVADAIRRVRPAGVDASSRLESSPGVKDHEAVRAFISTALDTFSELQA